MATSSIKHNFVFKNPKEVSSFVNAIEHAQNNLILAEQSKSSSNVHFDSSTAIIKNLKEKLK